MIDYYSLAGYLEITGKELPDDFKYETLLMLSEEQDCLVIPTGDTLPEYGKAFHISILTQLIP